MRVAQSDNEYKDYYIATTLAMIYILYIVIQHIFHILSSNIYYLIYCKHLGGSAVTEHITELDSPGTASSLPVCNHQKKSKVSNIYQIY